jgi:hypothetical protein
VTSRDEPGRETRPEKRKKPIVLIAPLLVCPWTAGTWSIVLLDP